MTKSKKDGKRRTAFSDECKPPQRLEGRLCQTLSLEPSLQHSPKIFNFASVLILVSWIEKLMLHIRNGRAMKSTQKDEPAEN